MHGSQAKITRILANISGRAEGAITGATKLEDLGIESLDVVEIAVEIEAEFGVTVTDDQVVNLATVGDVFGLVEKMERVKA